MNCGLMATIIEYINCNNLTIEFEDGVTKKGCRYLRFLEGSITHPTIKCSNSVSRNEFGIYYYLKSLGFKKIEQGEFKHLGFGNMELDLYNEDLKIAIEYDGVFHNQDSTRETDLRKNRCCKDNDITIYRIREKGTPKINDGISKNFYLKGDRRKILSQELADVLLLIFKENNLHPPDINFERDKEKILTSFNEQCYNKHRNSKIGLTKKMHCGIAATIIDYRSHLDIDVKFDDGTIIKNRSFKDFQNCSILHSDLTPERLKEKRLGEIRIMKNGMKAKIIGYRGNKDIDIEYKDGVQLFHKRYDAFLKGAIKHPKIKAMAEHKSQREGKALTMKCGMKAKIIAYRSAKDIDVEFEDGTVVYNKRYEKFLTGSIANPNYKNKFRVTAS